MKRSRSERTIVPGIYLDAWEYGGNYPNDIGTDPALRTVTTLSDSAQLDAFGRLRVSQPTTLFDSQQEYGLDTRTTWDIAANGTYGARYNTAPY